MDPKEGDGICPYDVLLDILRRLPCRPLAESRRVCRAWRAIVDAHRLLLPYFFPLDAFPGVFYNKDGCWASSAFFAAPASLSGRQRGGNHDKPVGSFRYPIFRHNIFTVQDHSNGLLLLRDGGRHLVDPYNCYVCNPTTVRYALLPRPPEQRFLEVHNMFLAFDPAVSLHYEVFFFPEIEIGYVPRESSSPILPAVPLDGVKDDTTEKVLSMQVYSTQTREWEERKFMPGHRCPRRLYDMMTDPHDDGALFLQELRLWCQAEYWRGSFYVHCRNNVLVILRCSAGTYDMVEFPGEPYQIKRCLGSHGRGIRYASLANFKVHVWELVESSANGELGWRLAHEADLEPYLHTVKSITPPPKVRWGFVKSSKGEISLFDDENTIRVNDDDHDDGAQEEEDPEHAWNWDDRNLVDVDGQSSDHPIRGTWTHYSGTILGFHPHKDVLLLDFDGTAVAYHLDASRRMQYLGNGLIDDSMEVLAQLEGGFPYRPCYVDVLPAKKMSRRYS